MWKPGSFLDKGNENDDEDLVNNYEYLYSEESPDNLEQNKNYVVNNCSIFQTFH